jgi:hypothetical protein
MDDRMLQLMRWGRQGYNCSQVLFLLALEARGRSCPDLVRAMAGLAYGGGSRRATCGTLTGGYCLLAFLSANTDDADRPAEQLPLLLDELTDWFANRVGQDPAEITCEAIVGAAGPAAVHQACGALVTDTYDQVLAILAAHGMPA